MQTEQRRNEEELKARLLTAKSRLLQNSGEKISCVILKNDELILSDALGIKPLMQHLRIDKKSFMDCVVADKIVGKAAALMLVLGGAQAVYGDIMSQGAVLVLEESNIYFEYGALVENIKNRDKTDLCPMEKTVLDINNPVIAFDALEETIAKLMAMK